MRTTKLKVADVEISTRNTVHVEEAKNEVVFTNSGGEKLSVMTLEDGGFQVNYEVDTPEDYKNVGRTQFRGGIIRRPGEEGFDFGAS